MMRTHVCRVTKRDVSHESDFEFIISENGKELFLGDPSLADDPTLKGLWDTEFGIEKLRPLASSPLYEGVQGVFQLYERMAFSVKACDVGRYVDGLKACGWKIKHCVAFG